MEDFKVSFLALSRSVDMNIASTSDINQMINEFILIFTHEIDSENFKININSLQQNTVEFKNKINTFVQKYKTADIKIQQLNTYFKELKEDEYFFFFPNCVIPQKQTFILYTYLSALEENKDFDTFNEETEQLFGFVRENYDMIAFNEHTKKKIGESDKSKRICRFCGRGSDKTTFKKIAHSISEALGNKKIITNDECDECNEKFGTGIENDLIIYSSLYRNVFGIKGKNGIPKLKGKNFEIENQGTIHIKHYLTDEEINNPNRDDFKFRLETTQKITAQNIYKTLSKYALSVIESSYLAYFSKTNQWINNEIKVTNLPKIAMLTSYDLYSSHPQIMVYIRKSDNFNLPYAVAEFRFSLLTFVYIIPLSSNDKMDFSVNKNYDEFWKSFKHYNLVNNWTFLNMNNDTAKTFVMNLNFEERKSNNP